jgi:hypothetical protein
VVTIKLGRFGGAIAIRPNPVVNDATVDVNALVAEKANWELTDITGKTVLQKPLVLVKGDNTFTINLGKLPAGMYYLKVTGNNIHESVKLQKL